MSIVLRLLVGYLTLMISYTNSYSVVLDFRASCSLRVHDDRVVVYIIAVQGRFFAGGATTASAFGTARNVMVSRMPR